MFCLLFVNCLSVYSDGLTHFLQSSAFDKSSNMTEAMSLMKQNKKFGKLHFGERNYIAERLEFRKHNDQLQTCLDKMLLNPQIHQYIHKNGYINKLSGADYEKCMVCFSEFAFAGIAYDYIYDLCILSRSDVDKMNFFEDMWDKIVHSSDIEEINDYILRAHEIHFKVAESRYKYDRWMDNLKCDDPFLRKTQGYHPASHPVLLKSRPVPSRARICVEI